ncbi:hypothetical protein QFC22_005489 [Naganishia vaughanmartiniae]|uniref:Uncharacterized protein n=1 Tax=Naganishia vaughanmartiniae TaxID=1424756 RepID=A0ACC2WU21_9TREE|nr:hypothetical protein QFC22_005489 [Naganishia vaughanmartiniae]
MSQTTLLNFFSVPTPTTCGTKLPSASTTKRQPQSKPRQIFSSPYDLSSQVPGLSVISEFITQNTEEELLRYLDRQPWRTDLARRTMHFGGTYCLMKKPGLQQSKAGESDKPEVIQAPPIPSEFNILMQLFSEQGIYQSDNLPEYCIVNEYKVDHGISAHIENFTFGEPVCSLSLHDGDFMRFHQLEAPDDGSVRSGKSRLAKRTGRKVDVWLPSRSLAVLRGDARFKWQHEIVRSKKRRVASCRGDEWKRTSLTFRVKR